MEGHVAGQGRADPLAHWLPGQTQQLNSPGVRSRASCLALPGGKEEGERLQVGVPPAQGTRAGSPPSPFESLEVVLLPPPPQVEAVMGGGTGKKCLGPALALVSPPYSK